MSNQVCQTYDIKQMFENSVYKYGEKPAFFIKNAKEIDSSVINYNDTYSDVSGLGTSLIARGMKDKRIAIIGKNSYEWAVSYLATICGTGVAVPLDKEFCITELKYFLNITGCNCVIFSGDLEDIFALVLEYLHSPFLELKLIYA